MEQKWKMEPSEIQQHAKKWNTSIFKFKILKEVMRSLEDIKCPLKLIADGIFHYISDCVFLHILKRNSLLQNQNSMQNTTKLRKVMQSAESMQISSEIHGKYIINCARRLLFSTKKTLVLLETRSESTCVVINAALGECFYALL